MTVFRFLLGFSFGLSSSFAHAHLSSGGMSDFYVGVLHTVESLQSLLTLLVLGLFLSQQAAQQGLTRINRSIFLFFVTIIIGVFIFTGGTHFSSIVLVNLTAIIVLGILVAFAKKLPVLVVYLVTLPMGLIHGYVIGTAIDPGRSIMLYAIGVGLVSFFSILFVCVLTDRAVLSERVWPPIIIRVLGSWLAAIGIMMTAFLLRL